METEEEIEVAYIQPCLGSGKAQMAEYFVKDTWVNAWMWWGEEIALSLFPDQSMRSDQWRKSSSPRTVKQAHTP